MRARPRARLLWLAGLFAALLIAGVLSRYASAAPDGLERVAQDNGITEQARERPAAASPLADHSGGVAGVIGVGVVLVVAGSLTWVVRRRRTQPEAASPHGG